ncbi:unnamed protein product [Microthlaspi erraticum]|uniref:Uncharacterized protein n=1 Tax=Microthlaspi erraticum TaxID=1685480 RepID=A0A6D2K443_9BRAS|nr:unnamed protein product [Microthlaspi erraticum]
MSRKGVIAKRVKTAPDGLSRISARTAQSGWPRNECSALGQNRVRPSLPKSRPKYDPGNIVPRSASHNVTPRRARPGARAGKQSLAAAQPVPRTTPMHPSEPGKNVPRPAEKPSAKSSSARPSRPTMKRSGHENQHGSCCSINLTLMHKRI